MRQPDSELHVVSFSGGKDSTFVLLEMLRRGMRVDSILNCDTTKEFPAMYDHIAQVQRAVAQQITTVKIDFDYWFAAHKKTKGARKGTHGYGWPDFRNRWCTALKREALSYAIIEGAAQYNPRKWGLL